MIGPGPMSTPVPEPASALLLMVGVAGGYAGRGRRRPSEPFLNPF
jgi:hypothetical protein